MKYDKADKKQQNVTSNIRLGVLVAILLAMTSLGAMHQLIGAGSSPSVDALCPFGGIEGLYTLVSSGVIMKRIAISSFILLIATLIAALIFKRAFCGQICPLGTLQELMGMLGSRFMKKKPQIPLNIDSGGRYIKYLVLILVVVFSAITGELVLRPYDPWVAWQHLASADLLTSFAWGLGILVVTLLGSIFVSRVFCRYLCPMGAFLALFAPLGRFGIVRKDATCIKCKICNRECPVGIDIMAVERVTSKECIACNACVNVCPVKDTLVIEEPGGKSISARAFTAAVLAIFLLTVGITTATGQFEWNTTSLRQEVAKSGSFDSSQIKGRMTIQEVADGTGIPTEAFKSEFKIEDKDLTVPMKDLLPIYGFEAEEVRVFVDEYLAEHPEI